MRYVKAELRDESVYPFPPIAREGITTFRSHPGHEIVGRYFQGWDGCNYYCDSYDSRHGYWMIDVANPTNDTEKRRNVSERAINRTFHVLWGYDRVPTCD